MSCKKIMILGASILQLPAIKKAKEMGLQVVAVDMDPGAVGFREPDIETEVISTIDIPGVLEAARRHRIDGIMTLASDMPVRSVAVVAREMSLIGVSEDTAVKATNKAAMRQALQEHGVPVPKFLKVATKAEYDAAVVQFDGEFVVKPADNSGSRGVIKTSRSEGVRSVDEAYRYSCQFSRSGEVVVEEYMTGPEVSVETLSVNGKCHVIQVTDKLTTGAPYFVEMGHSQPTGLDGETVGQIREVAIAANQAIGITDGPSHTEIIVTNEGPKIVEIGARLGGDCITSHLVPLSTGVDMVGSCIRIALGELPDLQKKWDRGSAIRYFSQASGIVQSITGVAEASADDGICQISIVHGEGENVASINNSAARMGFVVADGMDAAQAVDRCNKAMDKIQITIK